MKSILTIFALISVSILPTASVYAVGPNSVNSTVTITGTCGISLSQTTINYGTVSAGTNPVNATNNPLGITNTGSAPSAITVNGSNWIDSGHVMRIQSNETAFATTPIHSPVTPTKLAFPPGPVVITGSLAPSTTLSTFWQLIPKVIGVFAGVLSQNLTFSASC